MPGPIDFALVVLFAVVWPLHVTFVGWPQVLRRAAAAVPGFRLREYRSTMLEQWALAALVLVHWAVTRRPWPPLGFAWPHGWRAWAGLALVAAAAWLFTQQVRAVARRPERLRERLGGTLDKLRALLPHTRDELREFCALSFTAGFCEELLFRGMLVWTLQPWLGFWGAGVVSTVLFGLAHAYQGARGIQQTTIAGFLMLGVYALTGSLLPGMALHAIIDVGGGATMYHVLREPEPAPEAPSGSPA